MKRANQILTFSAAVGAGLLAASAYAQQPATQPTPARPQTSTQATPAPHATRGPSKEDRTAFFEAHVAAIHAGLRLTPDQERLWGPVESAIRDMARQMSERHDQRQVEAAPANPIERMARMGDMASARGQTMSRVAEMARPLYAALGDDQKRRLHILMRPPGHDHDFMHMGQNMGRGDEGGRHHHRMAEGGRGHQPGMRGEGPGMRQGDKTETGRGTDWR